MLVEDKKQTIRKISRDNPCLCFNIRKASRIITQVYEDSLRELGYTPSQIMILSGIRDLHSTTINELARALCTDRTTVSRNLRPLMKDGLIKPCDCADRRAKAVMLTEKGSAVFEEAAGIWYRQHQKISKAVGAQRMAKFLKEVNDILALVQKG